MKLERFNKNRKQKEILIGSIIAIILIIGGISLYRSFAMYEEKASFDVLKGTVPDFRKGKGDVNFIALTVNGEKTNKVPLKANFTDIKVECDNNATGEWDKEKWVLVTDIKEVPTSCTIDFILDSIEFDYLGKEQEFIVPVDGKYKIELWGASGGGKDSVGPYFGGYVSGDINLTQGTTFYIYVGQAGVDGTRERNFTPKSSYNGGGAGKDSTEPQGLPYSSAHVSGSGGGATDIRLQNGEWNNFEGLKSRIMVAGAGGGSGYYAGGIGGGLNGVYSEKENGDKVATGATQTSGYKFGQGANGASNIHAGGGGGGGYYGGFGGVAGGVGVTSFGGGGGSSYISGHDGCKAITQDSTSNSITHSSSSEHYSNYVFTNTVMIDGNGYNWTTEKGEKIGMPKHDGTEGTMDGNSGNGYARITYLGND